MKWLVFFLALFVIPGVFGAAYYDVNPFVITTSGSDAHNFGMRFRINTTETINITGSIKASGTGDTQAYLYNGTPVWPNTNFCPSGNVSTGTYSGDVAVFPGGMRANPGETWTICSNNGGSTRSTRYSGAVTGNTTGNSTFIIYDCSLYVTCQTANWFIHQGVTLQTLSAPPNASVISAVLYNNVTGGGIDVVSFSNKTGNITISFFNVTSTGFCATLTGNGTETNCTSGNGASTFYNVSVTELVTATQNVEASTYQNLIDLRAYKLYLNTSISSFNTTNQQAFNSTSTGNLLLRALNGSNNVLVQVGGNYSTNVTCLVTSPLTTGYCNATGIYDSIITVNATNVSNPVLNFGISITNTTLGLSMTNTTSGAGITYQVLQGFTYYLNFSKTDLSDANVSLTVLNNSYPYSFSVFPAPSINFTFYNEITDAPITDENITLEVINDAVSYNYTIVNGSGQFNLTGLNGNTIFRYYSDSYAQRDYILNVNPGGVYTLRLYDINLSLSQVVTATVLDTGNSLIENATITLLRYFVGCNCYRTVQMASTGADGTSIFYVQALDGHYKWSVSYQGTVYYLSTTSEQINSDTRTFTIDLGTNYYAGVAGLAGLSYLVTYNETTSTLVYTFSDTSGTVTAGCLQTRYRSGVAYVQLEYTCSAGSSGSVLTTVPDPNTSTYLYSASVNTTSAYTPVLVVDTGSVQPPDSFDFGNSGIFLSVGILIVLVSIFSFSAVATVVVSVVGIVAISLLGIMSFTTSFIVGIAALILGISLYLMRS